jgi:non-SMC mitotic condensation complex subunit 1
MCLVDSSKAVKGLAALFFTELSGRSNNPVYNLLGDIIGSLSGCSSVDAGGGGGDPLSEDVSTTTQLKDLCQQTRNNLPTRLKSQYLSTQQFQIAMTFLLKFANKDK